MNEIEEGTPIQLILFSAAIFGTLGFLIWQGFNPMTPMILIPPLLMACWIYLTRFEWNPFSESSNFIPSEGAICTLIKKPYPIGSGKWRCIISVSKKDVPEKIRSGYYKGWKGITSFFSGQVNIAVEGFAHDFIVPKESVSEGVIFYRRKLDGEYPNISLFGDNNLLNELKDYKYCISKLSTVVETYKGIGIQESNEQTENLTGTMRSIITILDPLLKNKTTIETQQKKDDIR